MPLEASALLPRRQSGIPRRLVALTALLLGTPAFAQSDLEIDSAQPWHSPVSEFVAPTTIEGFERTKVTQFDKDGYNVAAVYDDPQSNSRISVYFYRAGTPDLAVWADRAASGMLTRSELAPDLNRLLARTFTPSNGSGQQSGWIVAVPAEADGFSSTGLALFGHDGWMVKLRITSTSLDEQGLASLLEKVALGLDLGTSATTYPPFATVEDCAKPIAFGKEAKIVRLDMTSTIMFGAMMSAARDKADEIEAEAGQSDTVWCRHPSTTAQYGIYQPGDAKASYVVAFGDSGTSAVVGKLDAGRLLKPSTMYVVQVSDGVTEETALPFDRLPTPGQTIGAALRSPRISTVDVRPGGDGETTINVTAEE